MEKEKEKDSRKGASGMREPANLYEAVIALESFKHRQPAPPPAAPTLTQEQQEKLKQAIADVIAAGRGKDNERNH